MNQLINLKDTYQTLKNIGSDINKFIPRRQAGPPTLTRRRRRIPRPLNFRPELKILDLTPNAFYSKFDGTFLLLNGIAQGVGDSQRVGRKIKMVSLRLKCSYNGPSAYNSDTLRCVLMTVRAPGDQDPAIADVFKQTGNDLVVDSFRNNSYLEDFRFIRDVKFVNNPVSANVAHNGTFNIRCNLSQYVGYSGTGATIASINQNALYLLVVGKYAAGSSDTYKNYLTVTGQLRYYDH